MKWNNLIAYQQFFFILYDSSLTNKKLKIEPEFYWSCAIQCLKKL